MLVVLVDKMFECWIALAPENCIDGFSPTLFCVCCWVVDLIELVAFATKFDLANLLVSLRVWLLDDGCFCSNCDLNKLLLLVSRLVSDGVVIGDELDDIISVDDGLQVDTLLIQTVFANAFWWLVGVVVELVGVYLKAGCLSLDLICFVWSSEDNHFWKIDTKKTNNYYLIIVFELVNKMKMQPIV